MFKNILPLFTSIYLQPLVTILPTLHLCRISKCRFLDFFPLDKMQGLLRFHSIEIFKENLHPDVFNQLNQKIGQ